MNEDGTPSISDLIKDLSQKIEDAFEKFKDDCCSSDISFSESGYDRAIHTAGKYFDMGIETLIKYIR